MTEMLHLTDGFVCIKSNAVSRVSSNFSSEEYRHRFRIKSGVAFRLAPPYGGLLVLYLRARPSILDVDVDIRLTDRLRGGLRSESIFRRGEPEHGTVTGGRGHW